LFVAKSRHLVLARIKTPKNSYKIHESTVSCTLLMSGVKNFAGDATFQNRAPRDIFTHPTKKLPYHSQIFARKPEPNSPRVLSSQRAISALRPYVSPLS